MDLDIKEATAYSGKTYERLNIDRKVIGIIVIFVVLGVFLVISTVIATNTLSGLRGFSTFQTNWTEARKEAVFQLANYLRTLDKDDKAAYDSVRALIDDASDLRRELLKDDTDPDLVREKFLRLHITRGDIGKMITTFERFHNFPDFKIAVEEWIKSDQMISEMDSLVFNAHELTATSSFTNELRTQYVADIEHLDRRLTLSQFRLAGALSTGTALLNSIILWVSVSLGCILLGTGGLLFFRFSKSIKGWTRELEMNEQKYRSLFEQNPNAVFSINKEGYFFEANDVLVEMTGYSMEELKNKRFDHFVEESELRKVSTHFKKSLEGKPQTFETIGVSGTKELAYLEVTNLPILVDGEIIGIYGIAHDITERKKAEQKVQEQLKEKVHLLSEVHDRVKNNLALITSLIQLQEMNAEDPEHFYLGSTISRIHSIAMVHEQLYQNEKFSSIRMDKYVKELIESTRKKYSGDTKEINLKIECEPIILSINQAIPAGLLLNELLVNAFKYGLNDDGGEIEVSFYRNKKEIKIKVRDKGPGLPDHVDINNPATLGMRLISELIKQLHGVYEVERKEGTSFIVRFNLNYEN